MRKIGFALAAAALMGVAMPATTAEAKPQFSGFAAEATATPLKIAIYEPVLPIPSEPQAELDFAYTKAESATGPSAVGRASWVWPGDAVGEGCKTFVELIGLGATGLCADGYPVQVNSQTPGGPEHADDEPFPGAVMRTSSSADRTIAKVGFATDGDVEEREPQEGGDLPESPLPLPPGDLSQLGAAITGKAAEPEPAANALFPEELAAIVDVGQMSSISELVTGGDVIRSVGHSRISDLSLLGGLITADSIRVTTTATSNGRKAVADVSSRVAGLAIAGNQFTIDRDGVQAAGQPSPIDGLPDEPSKALEQIGVSFQLPQGSRSAKGEQSSAHLEGLQIIIDTRVLRSQLDTGALEEAVAGITGQLPPEAVQLKGAVGALFQLAPKVVITAGNASAAATTIQGVAFPPIDLPDVPGDISAGGGSGVSGGAVSGGTGALPGDAAPAPAADAGAPVTTDVATEPVAAGLPPLASIPGALLVGGLILASGAGWWLQRIGGFVIGGAGACAHGLETGIPDLRKA